MSFIKPIEMLFAYKILTEYTFFGHFITCINSKPGSKIMKTS